MPESSEEGFIQIVGNYYHDAHARAVSFGGVPGMTHGAADRGQILWFAALAKPLCDRKIKG